jgi:hypothetical protein
MAATLKKLRHLNHVTIAAGMSLREFNRAARTVNSRWPNYFGICRMTAPM